MTEAANGEQAIEASAKYAFDLIVLDIMMPGMNGYQTCVEIRKKEQQRAYPFSECQIPGR